MNESNKEINNDMYELEDLSAKMARDVNLGNFLAISKMDQERKSIIKKISKDVANISSNNKKKLRLIWTNNNILIDNINLQLQKKKEFHNKLRKTLKAYSSND